jgi:hypothetical protein
MARDAEGLPSKIKMTLFYEKVANGHDQDFGARAMLVQSFSSTRSSSGKEIPSY